MLGAQYVYWSQPDADVVGGMQARFFVPLLVLVPIIDRTASRAMGKRRQRRGFRAALLVPLYMALLVTITFRMY